MLAFQWNSHKNGIVTMLQREDLNCTIKVKTAILLEKYLTSYHKI